MGNLLKVLTREIENYPHFFLDFESKSGRGEEHRRKRWMEKDVGRVEVLSSQLFPFCQQVSKPDDTAVQELFLCFAFVLPLSRDLLLFQL